MIIIIIIIIIITIIIIIIIIIIVIIIIIISRGDGYLGRREPSCLYNHGPAVRLFVYRISLQEVFLHKGVLKKSSKFSCKKAPILTCNFNKVALQFYIKITPQHGCSLVNLQHFSTQLLIRAPLQKCFCVYWNILEVLRCENQ